jgi:hypothetical protein
MEDWDEENIKESVPMNEKKDKENEEVLEIKSNQELFENIGKNMELSNQTIKNLKLFMESK